MFPQLFMKSSPICLLCLPNLNKTLEIKQYLDYLNFKPEVMNDVNKAYAFDTHSATLDSYAEPHFKYSFFFFLR